MIKKAIGASGLALLLFSVAAHGEPVIYTWTGTGTNVSGSTKCPTYKMTIDVTVEGSAVKGIFQQQGRDQRHFEAALDGKGMFKTKAQVGGGGTMDVNGAISDKDTHILLDGYCKFGGKLIKK
jgi:hypothetical protein